ncbi:MAG: hypothetical protein JNK98_06155 [Chitinophagaceae bacterium]|nr:hypothetical protein [Chitinophagaceae bacterium]
MKNIFLSLLMIIGSLSLNAQTDSLEQYTGKYKFPEGSPVTEIGIVVENGTLMAASAMGNSEFRRTDTKDVFEVVAYAGTATFRRNDQNKVVGVLIQVQDITMEGSKAESIAGFLFLRNLMLGSAGNTLTGLFVY